MKDIPQILLRQLEHVKGFDKESFLNAHLQSAPTSVRRNPQKDIGLFKGEESVPWCDDSIYLPQRPVFTLDPAYHAGAYYVQEASSMFLSHMLKNVLQDRKGIRVLDLCGAPGGKSTLIASVLDKDSLLIANEVIRARAAILEENITRWGYMNTWVTSNDPRDFARLPGYFDVIVVDAPCSGSGLWRKEEAALDEWSEANVQLCSERQHRILADVWPALKQNGILIYATCSYSPQEDEEVLDWLADTFDVDTIGVPLKTEWGIREIKSQRKMTGYRFFPGKVKGEGFFIAALRKIGTQHEINPPRYKPSSEKKIQQQASYLLKDKEYCFLQRDKESYCAINAVHEPDWHILQKPVYLRKTGINLGQPVVKEWLPDHEVALSIEANEKLPHINVNTAQALRFLKREEMGLSDIEKGWWMIAYNGLGLGWVKALGNRINNYLPKHWRIRMDIEG